MGSGLSYKWCHLSPEEQPTRLCHLPGNHLISGECDWKLRNFRNAGIFPSEVPVFTAGQQGKCAAVTPAHGFGDIISCEHQYPRAHKGMWLEGEESHPRKEGRPSPFYAFTLKTDSKFSFRKGRFPCQHPCEASVSAGRITGCDIAAKGLLSPAEGLGLCERAVETLQ